MGMILDNLCYHDITVGPMNKGHYGANDRVPCRELGRPYLGDQVYISIGLKQVSFVERSPLSL